MLQRIFHAFGSSLLGQLAAATLISAAIPLLVWKKAQIPNEQILAWSVGCGVVGLSAGLFLVSRKLVLGAILLLLGGFVTFAPLSLVDGTQVSLSAHVIKYGIGLLLLVFSVWLLVSGLRRIVDSKAQATSGRIPQDKSSS